MTLSTAFELGTAAMTTSLVTSCLDASLGDLITPSAITQGVVPGCFHLGDLSNADYHSLPDSVSCSGLKHLLRSPAHYQAYLDGRNEDNKPNIVAGVVNP